MRDIPNITFAVCALAMPMLIISAGLTFESSENKIMEIGDEVATTDEYNTLFNESFSGRIVSIDRVYTVRDDNGNERTFGRKWIDHVDGGDI